MSPPVCMHDGLICIAFCLSVSLYVWPCTGHLMHHFIGMGASCPPFRALCTTLRLVHHGAQGKVYAQTVYCAGSRLSHKLLVCEVGSLQCQVAFF